MFRFALSMAIAGPVCAQNSAIQGAGATFPSSVYQKWAQGFEQTKAITVQYQATGSGDGQQQIAERKVAFGGTDSPLKGDQLQSKSLVQFPTVVGAVVPVVKLKLPQGKKLKLNGEVLADIFLGRITRWNDQRISELNPDFNLPSTPIQRIVRSDRSGTTDAYTRYLSAVSPAFARELGPSQLPAWTGEFASAQGNGGVAKLLQSTEGGITYVGYDQVLKYKLQDVMMRQASGRWVEVNDQSITTAVQSSDVHKKGDDMANMLNLSEPGAWPITVLTFVLMDAKPARAHDVQSAVQFFFWAFQQGDKAIKGTGFVPLPLMLQARLSARLMAIKPKDGSFVQVF